MPFLSPPTSPLFPPPASPVPTSSDDDQPLDPFDHGPSVSPPQPTHPSAGGGKHKNYKPGHRWDDNRVLEPVICPRIDPSTAHRWKAMAAQTANPGPPRQVSTVVKPEWLEQHMASLEGPWIPPEKSSHAGEGHDEEGLAPGVAKQWNRLERATMRSPVVPLVLRLLIWIFSLVALVLGATIYRQRYNGNAGSNTSTGAATQLGIAYFTTSPEMAIIVDAIALVYLIYVAWDEYTGKPAGLRSAKAKLRLILVDLLFIVFDSANLALAFESIYAAGRGTLVGEDPNVMGSQKALASVLLLALVAWLMTFSISVLRIVERVAT